MAGLAPGARLIPIRVAQQVTDGNSVSQIGGGPQELAAGIRWASEQGARVIAVTVTTPQDSPELRDAVGAATARGSLVVSGGAGEDNDAGSSAARYPSAYPQVVAVGAVAEDGSTLATADQSDYIDLVAPAGAAVSTAPVGERGRLGHTPPQDEPAAATAAVAATAALMVEREPSLTPAQIIRRMIGTAIPGPAGPPVLSPRDAVTSRPVGVARQPVAGDVVRAAVDPGRTKAETASLQIAGGALLALGLAVATAVVLRGDDRPPDRRQRRSTSS